MNHRSVFQTKSFETGTRRTPVNRMMARLTVALVLLLPLAVRAEDWLQFRGPNRDSVWNEAGSLQTFPAEGLKIRWRAPVGAGFTSPVVAGGRVYLTDSELK